MDVAEAISTRRSVGRVSESPVPREVIESLLNAAVAAPNHHETQPWRFFVLTGKAREAFAEVLVQSLARRRPGADAARLEALSTAERMKPMRAPVLIVVASKHSDSPRIVPTEDLQACSAAIQNLLLAAHAMGLGAMWRTGDGVYDAEVKAHFGLDPEDQIAGVVYVGYPVPADGNGNGPAPRARSFEPFTEWRIDEAG